MRAGRNNGVVKEILADLAAEGGLERRDFGQRGVKPVCGIGNVEGEIHWEGIGLGPEPWPVQGLIEGAEEYKVQNREASSKTKKCAKADASLIFVRVPHRP